MSLITSALTSAIIAFAVSTVPILIGRRTKLAKAKRKENGDKTIDYASSVFGMIYGGGALFTILGVLVYFFSNEPIAGIMFIVMGLIFLLPIMVIQIVDTSLNWTSDYIEGARSGVSLRKNKLSWDDIIQVKHLPNQTIQVKDKSDRKVVWSVYHKGWHEIIDDLQHIRPDIDTSDFD